ncbi:MAG: 30S ribosomal protein S6 [Alphaproteobacteria bacterium]|nr:30S ribosomal protein S6 [Alphaproteobacteria bacterium]
MPIYETVFMARQDLTEAQVKDLTANFSKIITQQGGKILKTEFWGLRTLAYVINKSRRAHYVLLEFDAPGAAVIELERNLRLHEDVMRSLSVKLEAPSKGPSALLEKSGRDDEEREAA